MSIADVLALYPEYHKVYGPYKRKDGRSIVVLYDGANRSARQLAKVLLEVKLGRRLLHGETVDHIDGNFTNDSPDNLQVLSLADNISKSMTGNSYALGSKRTKAQIQSGDKNGMARITNDWAKAARERFKNRTATRKQLEKESGLSDRSIRNMLAGISYK